jgi:hypothetical protein
MSETGSVWGKAFDRFFPWIVTGAVAFAAFTGRFQATESQAVSTATQVNELRGELKDVRDEMVNLKVSIGQLTTALRYLGARASDEDEAATPKARPGQRPRQFDH